MPAKGSSKRKQFIDGLFVQLRFCPMCGIELLKFGSDTEMKTCPNEHGTAYVTGKRNGQKVGMFLEIFEE